MHKIVLATFICATASFAQVNQTTCKSCHGIDYEKAALGQSKIVRDMTKSEVSAALIGYKNGTYGNNMKGVMTSNVKMYSNKELSSTGIGSSNKKSKQAIKSSIDLASCKSCHGQNFEKSALGQSKVVRDMTRDEVSAALIGYKNGTYGRSMKNMMKNHVIMYTNKELSITGIGRDNKRNKKIIKSSIDLVSCIECHGINFEKSALGQSRIVGDMTKDEVSAALIGYKNGTYGRSMKNMMKSHVIMYSDEKLRNTGIGQ